MSRFIIEVEGWLLEWSSVTDSPYTYGMKPDEFRVYYREEYGAEGMRDLEQRMARVAAHGTSSMHGESAEDVMDGYNRAGYQGTYLTTPEIVQIYCVERRRPVEGEGRVVKYDDDKIDP